jgi:cyanophycinase
VGAVYAMDGAGITYSSRSEALARAIMSHYDVRLHVLARHNRFDLARHRPILNHDSQPTRQ